MLITYPTLTLQRRIEAVYSSANRDFSPRSGVLQLSFGHAVIFYIVSIYPNNEDGLSFE
jgi:hypothetical protein